MYAILNGAFAIVAIAAAHFLRGKTDLRKVLITAATVLVVTAFGDNFIVGSGIVSYDSNKILGIRIGVAPIEDFAYALVAAFLVPVVWNLLEKRK